VTDPIDSIGSLNERQTGKNTGMRKQTNKKEKERKQDKTNF
jgi:hypothetical protein